MKRPHWSRTISHQFDDKENEDEFSSINNLLTTTDTLMCENDFQLKPTEKGTCEPVEDSIHEFQSSYIVDGTKIKYQQGEMHFLLYPLCLMDLTYTFSLSLHPLCLIWYYLANSHLCFAFSITLSTSK